MIRWSGYTSYILGGWLVGGMAFAVAGAVKPPAPQAPPAKKAAAKSPGKKAGAIRKPVSKPAAKTPAAPKPAAPATPASAPANDGTRADLPPETVEFFETHVRPVLATNCFTCHGPQLQQADLRVDTMAGLLKGSHGKPAVIPGDPDNSPLIQVIRYDHKVKMPPMGKLPQKDIDALTEWVKMGAPWPSAKGRTAGSGKAGAVHWAFRPVKKPALPAVKNAAWVKNSLDTFILSKLEAKGLKPSPAADRRTLIRRAYFNLIGLPPTYEEVEAFVNDPAPDAYEKVVDRLLASPHYGERWGRFWLDVARYSDTKGYVFAEDRGYPHAWTYRDWVIDAFNRDLPYNQFLIQQIAADRLPLGANKKPLAAMGFLTLGRRFLNNPHDIIDDRIDVVFRGTQALTVACARCHDHKFDPIPTKDYYSLYGIFQSSIEPDNKPILAGPEKERAYRAYEDELRKREGEANKFRDAKGEEAMARAKAKIADSMLAAQDGAQPNAKIDEIAKRYDLPPFLVTKWKDFLGGLEGTHAVMGGWKRFAALPESEFAAKAPELAKELAANAQSTLNAHVAKLFEGEPPASLREVAERHAKLLAAPPEGDDQLRHAITAIGGPLNLDANQQVELFSPADKEQLQALRAQVEEWKKTAPEAPPRAMVMVDKPKPETPRVFVRGNPGSPGEEVPRQFLAVLSGPDRKPFTEGSGRLELAKSIANKENPLTARVMVNRVWMYHFGKPLVGTPGDFGLRSDPPTHPELLDYLAWRFMEEGWSLKKLHRFMLLSSAFRQSSADNAAARKIDPENELVWRMNRRRMDFEAMRDAVLAVSGELDRTLGGPSVPITGEKASLRRAAYGFIDRQNLPNLFRTFDFASPDSTSPMRYFTTVPQQALFMMNSPFIVARAQGLTARQEVAGQSGDEQRLQSLYRAVYGRTATPDEVKIGLQFLRRAEALHTQRQPPKPVWQYGFGEVDAAAGRVKSFTPLPHFTGNAWQGGPELPDPKTGWATLNATGGHPGSNPQHAAIRRWIAPRDGRFSVTGTLGHGNPADHVPGDGVRARLITSRDGVVAEWTAQNSQQETAASFTVKRGDTVDFVVDCRSGVSNDSFRWAPTVQVPDDARAKAEGAVSWSAQNEFSGPVDESKAEGLNPWQQYAQALLLSNEFIFVD